MENKLEQLLNSLIQKGWKPRNVISKNIYIYKIEDKINLSYSEFLEDEWEFMHEDEWYSFRELVSKESWLWQFVCENGMINNVWNFIYRRLRDGKKFWLDKPITHFTFRIIESALCDEDKLENFILDNIKIEWTK